MITKANVVWDLCVDFRILQTFEKTTQSIVAWTFMIMSLGKCRLKISVSILNAFSLFLFVTMLADVSALYVGKYFRFNDFVTLYSSRWRKSIFVSQDLRTENSLCKFDFHVNVCLFLFPIFVNRFFVIQDAASQPYCNSYVIQETASQCYSMYAFEFNIKKNINYFYSVLLFFSP